MAEPPVDRFAWLDEVMARISHIYAPDFTLEPAGKEESYEAKHGSCFKCTYRFVFTEGARQALPNEEGMQLMKIIKSAARAAKADPPLIRTKTKGQHDWCDWGWSPTGAEMWIYLEVPKDSQKRG